MYLEFGTLGIPSGGGGCAAHRPPHQKGRRQSAGNCKSVATASINACGPHGPLAVQEALGQILLAADRPRPSRFHKKHSVMKFEAQRTACQNMPPKPSKTQPGMPRNPPKSSPRASWEATVHPKAPERSQVAPESAQEMAKKRPRGSKSRPRAAKSRPRDVQEASKSASDPSQVEPGTLQDGFGARFWWRALFDRL